MILVLESAPSWIPGLPSALEGLGIEVELDFTTQRTDMRAVRASVATHRPSTVLLSGFVRERGDEDPEWSFAQNAEAAINVAAACMEFDATAVLLSTAEVFGQSGGPFSESDEPIPASAWAESRLKGEAFLQRAARDRALILRLGELVEVQAGRYAAGLREEAEDERVSPLHTEHLARAIVDLLNARVRGIVHVASGGDPVSRADLLSFAAGNAPIAGRPGRSLGYLGPRARSPTLLTARLFELRGKALPDWRTAPAVDIDVSEGSLQVQTIGPGGVLAEAASLRVRHLALGRDGEAVSFRGGFETVTVFVMQGKVVVEAGDADCVLRPGKFSRITRGSGGRVVSLAAGSTVIIVENGLE